MQPHLFDDSPWHDTGAVFDATRRYRYALWRQWQEECGKSHTLHFIMLNPSTADEHVLDPTVTRCVLRAQQLGYRRLVVTNLFAWRSTDPSGLTKVDDPVGAENDESIHHHAQSSAMTVCAWGNHGGLHGRSEHVLRLLAGIPLYHLGLTKQQQPTHPLYVSLRKPLQPWN